MTFKSVQLTGVAKPMTIVTEDNDNTMQYRGTCWWCGTQYESNDPNVPCHDCNEPIEYKDAWQPAQ